MTVLSPSPDQVVVRAEGCIVSDMGNEKVMMSIRNGKYYNLGEVGGRMIKKMEGFSSYPTTCHHHGNYNFFLVKKNLTRS